MEKSTDTDPVNKLKIIKKKLFIDRGGSVERY